MDASEALKLLRESAAEITAESAQETISATAPDDPQKAFTSYTWDLRTDPHYAYLREQEEYFKRMLHGHPGRPFKMRKDGKGIDLDDLGRGPKAAAQVRRSPLFSCCVVGNGPEPLCSG